MARRLDGEWSMEYGSCGVFHGSPIGTALSVHRVSSNLYIFLCTGTVASPCFPPFHHIHHSTSKSPLSKSPLSLKTALPPIHHQIRTIDIAPRLRAQQHHRPRQLLRHTHPPHRIPLTPRPPRQLQAFPFVEYRVHVSRRDGVDADAVDGPFGGQGGLKTYERGFGGVVGGLGLGVVGAVGGDGGDEEDGEGEVEGDL